MRTVEWTDPAIRDLEAIDDYSTVYSVDDADRVIRLIERAAGFLTTTPDAGPEMEAIAARKWRVATTDYLLLYRSTPERIEILRIRHARENWMSL